MNKTAIATIFAALAASQALNGADYTATEGTWEIHIEEATRKLTLCHDGAPLLNGVYAAATYNYLGETADHTISSLDASAMPSITVEDVNDEFGQGKTYILAYKADGDEALLEHRLSFYPALPYMLAQVRVSGGEGKRVESRSLTALAVNEPSTPLTGASNRMVWVPFDNDGHLKYEVNLMTGGVDKECVSHEVGYVFDGESRRGLIAGSVDHDLWKSGVTIAGSNGYKIEKFECLSGLTNYFTRDALPHGKVKGESVSSARFFVGLYDDWRMGLNDFGDANTKVAPKATWTGGNPIGWSSWGVQQNYITFDGVEDCARFIKDNLFDLGFHNLEGKTVMSLDAFATDNIPSNKLYNLGTKVFSDGTYRDGRDTKEGTDQILGQYCGPLVVWSWALDSKVQGTGLNGTPDYYGRDIALKVNGAPHVINSNGGCAVDPTHPGVKANIEFFMKQFATNGTKYIKVDFLNNGIIEGDSWYDPEVTTGVQAYNYGMKLLYEEASKYGMYIVESISPIFPYRYAHGRRTCCDRFSEIGETEYVMNAMTYGWWTDRLYTVNDPDQLVMCKGGHGARETIGENRARATSGMATGAYIFGDNFSDNVTYTDDNGHTRGDIVGYPEESRSRAISIMGNADINEYVRTHTGSFMPVDGHKPSSSQSAESIFMRRTEDALYVAVFNYKTLFASSGTISTARLGIDAEDVADIKELWTGETPSLDPNGSLPYSVPAKDARVYRLSLNKSGAVDAVAAWEGDATISLVHTGVSQYSIQSQDTVGSVAVYSPSGQMVKTSGDTILDMSALPRGLYLVKITLTSGHASTLKIIND